MPNRFNEYLQKPAKYLQHPLQHVRHPFNCHKFPNTPTPPLPSALTPALPPVTTAHKIYDNPPRPAVVQAHSNPPMPAPVNVSNNPQPPRSVEYPQLIPPESLVKVCVFCRAGCEQGELITLQEMHSNPSCHVSTQFHLSCVMNFWLKTHSAHFEHLIQRTNSLEEFRLLSHSADFYYYLWSTDVMCECGSRMHLKFYHANSGLGECFAEAQRIMDQRWLQLHPLVAASQFIPPYAIPIDDRVLPLLLGHGPGSKCSVCLEMINGSNAISTFPICGHSCHWRCVDGWRGGQLTLTGREPGTCPRCS